MAVMSLSREASKDEMGREIDRRGAVIDTLTEERDRLKRERDEWQDKYDKYGIRFEKYICEKAGYTFYPDGRISSVMFVDRLVAERDRLKEIVDGTGLATAAIAAERDRLAKANAELLADQRETLKAVLYHFGPEGAQKVTAHTLEQRKARALLDKHKATSTGGE